MQKMEVKSESESSVKNIKNVENLDEIDFDKIDLTRGETPDNIREKCFQLCKDYLSGNWMKQTVDTIEVRRISGGLTNQLYYCGITEPLSDTDVPQEVAIRLYGQKHFNNLDCGDNERLTDIVIGLLVSENKLGPKIYGIFEGGQIQQYYQHRQFKLEEQSNHKLVKQVFEKLAQIHAMVVPIKRTNNWLFNEIDNSFKIICKKQLIRQMTEEFGFEIFNKYDIKTEIDFIKQLILKCESPVVFTHLDYRSSNLMITKSQNSCNSDEEIVVCDFEYSCYGYRGYDFALLLREWGRNPFDFKSIDNLPPDDSVLKPLVELYINESERLLGKGFTKNPINSVDNIIKEIKIFLLIGIIFGIIFICAKSEDKKNEFVFDRKVSLQLAEVSYGNYFLVKEKLRKQNII